MLQGKSLNKVDEKGRFRMPTRFKPELGKNLIITKDFKDCLVILSESLVATIKEKLQAVAFTDEEAQENIRIFTASSYELEEDSQGRYTLPAELKKEAGIDKDIVIVGAVTKVEVWSKESWDNELAKNSEKYKNPMAALKSLGI